MQLGLDIIFPTQQFQIGDRLETDYLVAARCIDDEVAGDREEIGAAGRDIFPVFGGVGPRHDFRAHIFQLMRRRKNPAKATTQRGLLRQYHGFEPV